MWITNGIIASCILGMISAADQHEEMRCKARPGCHLAKCDSNANEYPVTCVRTSAQDGGEYKELKSEMTIMRTEFELLKYKKTKMDENMAALSEDFTSYASRILTLENENKKTTAEMETLKTKLSKSEQSNKALLKDFTSSASRILTLENENKKTTAEMETLKTKLSKSEQSNKALLKDFTSYGSRISTLENENKKTTAEMETMKTKLSKSEQSNKALLKDFTSYASRISTLENENKKTTAEMETLKTRLSKSEQSNKAFLKAIVRSCDDAQLESALARNDSGGVFNSYIPAIGFRGIYCDVTDDGGNWTVLQRRMNGAVDFNRGWDDYVKGFGDLQGDHWLGLEALHQLTKGGDTEMKIKMITRKGIHWVAKYSSFRIGSGSDKYRLRVSGFSGNTGDALAYSYNQQFSTYDADHDGSFVNCASDREGGWWYDSCAQSNMNGNFNKTGVEGIWLFVYPSFNHLRFSEMKFRKRS